MLIELNRIVSKKKKDKRGNVIPDPANTGKFLYRNEVSVESFDSSEIKRMRPWNSSTEYPEIDGNITVIILSDGAKREEIRVNESHSDLLERLQGLKLEHQYGKEDIAKPNS
jgi:hypothetical protein